MAVPQRTALTLPDPRGVAQTIELVKWAEEQGYDDLWFADSSGVDALTTAAAVCEIMKSNWGWRSQTSLPVQKIKLMMSLLGKVFLSLVVQPLGI